MVESPRHAIALLLLVNVVFSVPVWGQETDPQATSQKPTDDQSPLVALAAAEATRAKVHVAGMIDHASLKKRKLGGESSYTFDLRDDDGAVLEVVAAGSPPFGFERTDIVVVEGRWRDGAFRATAVLIPGSNRGLLGVMVITLIVWLGLFAYVYSVDRRLKGLEKS